jgi:hypothetical protein
MNKDLNKVFASLDKLNSEASFLNRLGVPRLQSTRDWLADPTNAIPYLERLAPGILDDVDKDTFQTGLLTLRTTIFSLNEAYTKRETEDRRIDEMTPEKREELGITQEDQERHKERTLHMRRMLDSIKEFMIPYEEKEDRLKPKPTVKVVKEKPVNPFLVFRTHELSETVPANGAEEPKSAEPNRAEVREPKGAKKKGKEKKKKEVGVSTNYEVTTFDYKDLLEPTSLCFTENKMFIFSKDLITLLFFDVTTSTMSREQIETSKLNLSFCELKGNDILLTYGNTLHKIQFNEANQITSFEIIDSQITYKGVSFLSETDIFCVGSNKLYRTSLSNKILGNIPLQLSLNNPMGIRVGTEFLVIADSGNHRIVIVNYTTLGGSTTCTTIGDKTPGFKNGKSPKFNSPMDVLILSDNSILVSDTGNHSIRRIYEIEGEWITETIAGNGSPGFENGIGDDARFHEPYGLRFFGNVVYVADKNNNAIRIIQYNGM